MWHYCNSWIVHTQQKIIAHTIAHTIVHFCYAHIRVTLRMAIALCVEPKCAIGIILSYIQHKFIVLLMQVPTIVHIRLQHT